MSVRLPASRDGRIAVAAAGALLAVVVLAVAADALVPSPSGPPSSAFATAPAGVAAWAELAEREGHEVRAVRSRPTAQALPSAGTAVVLDPDELTGREAQALRRFAQDGGRVVAGGVDPGPWLETLTGGPVAEWRAGGSRSAHVLGFRLSGVTAIRTAGAGHWKLSGAAQPMVGGGRGATIATLAAGRGEIILVADPSPLQNRLLAQADNAALALALAGSGPLVFVEGVHGYGAARGLRALPARLGWALGLLGLAFAVLVAARWRRFGPPEPDRRPLPPSRQAYVESLGATLARGRQAEAALAGVRAEARARLARRSRLAPDADEAQWRDAALAAGLDPAAAAAVSGGVGADVTAPGRAMARLGDRGT